MGTHVSTIEVHKSCLVQKKDLYRGIFSFRHYLSVSQVINVLYKEVFFLIFRHYQLVNQVKWSLLHLRMDVLLHYGRVVQNQRLNIIQSINQTQRKGRLKFYSSRDMAHTTAQLLAYIYIYIYIYIQRLKNQSTINLTGCWIVTV